MLVGTNYHPIHGISAREVAKSNTQIVRYPMWGVYKQWTDSALRRGIQPMFVLDSKALPGNPAVRVRLLLEKHPDVLYWQVGNESDQPNSDSSWYQEPEALNELLRGLCPILRAHGKYILAPGMVSGNPSYLDAVDLELVDAIAVHPYGQAPNNWNNWGFGHVGDLLAGYRRFGKPIHITEFGGQESLFSNEHERAVYHTDMIRSLANEGCESAIQFSFTDKMHAENFGLVDVHGNIKESYAAFKDAIPVED